MKDELGNAIGKRDITKFPTRFGPSTTRMPPLPNLKGAPTTGKYGVERVPGKRRSTWKERSPKMRGPRGPKRVDKNRTTVRARRSAANKASRRSRKINRGGN